jgi:heme A synthase
MDTTMTYAGTTISHAAGRGLGLIRALARVNLGLVALQAVSAGFFLSGYGRAVTFHAAVAFALQLGALMQVVTAVVLWRRRRVPGGVAGISIGLFLIVLLQVGLGYSKRYWLHVPIGVGLFGGLIRQTAMLDTLRRADGLRQ